MFEQFKGYHKPEISKASKKCVTALYIPLNPKDNIIVGISTSDTTKDGIMYLKDNTLINISNNIILKLLNTIPKKRKKIKNKRKKVLG